MIPPPSAAMALAQAVGNRRMKLDEGQRVPKSAKLPDQSVFGSRSAKSTQSPLKNPVLRMGTWCTFLTAAIV